MARHLHLRVARSEVGQFDAKARATGLPPGRTRQTSRPRRSSSWTARRTRRRISAVMCWAVAQGPRETTLPEAPSGQRFPGPAAAPGAHGRRRSRRSAERWRGCARRGPDPQAFFECLALSAYQSGDVRRKQWDEGDSQAQQWRIPATDDDSGAPRASSHGSARGSAGGAILDGSDLWSRQSAAASPMQRSRRRSANSVSGGTKGVEERTKKEPRGRLAPGFRLVSVIQISRECSDPSSLPPRTWHREPPRHR